MCTGFRGNWQRRGGIINRVQMVYKSVCITILDQKDDYNQIPGL